MSNPYCKNNKKRRRNQNKDSSFFTTTDQRNNKSECFAIVSGRQDGIYFSRQEMMQQKQGHRSCTIRSFKSIAQAKLYLEKQHSLVPVETGGWITTDGKPILYKKRNDTISTSSKNAQPVIYIDSSPEEKASKSNNIYATATAKKRKTTTNVKKEVVEVYSDSDSIDTEDKRTRISPPPFSLNIHFDKIQQEAIDAAFEGKNVFITGVAGTGKSLVTRKIVEDAKAMRREIACAAPTGTSVHWINHEHIDSNRHV
jgi:ATP-dependent exoDNAse (exonuclease V) alpha subunit